MKKYEELVKLSQDPEKCDRLTDRQTDAQTANHKSISGFTGRGLTKKSSRPVRVNTRLKHVSSSSVSSPESPVGTPGWASPALTCCTWCMAKDVDGHNVHEDLPRETLRGHMCGQTTCQLVGDFSRFNQVCVWSGYKQLSMVNQQVCVWSGYKHLSMVSQPGLCMGVSTSS